MSPQDDPKIVVMDGSMGRQLCLDGMPQDDLFRKIWSARALVDESLHRLVIDAHKSYIEAGATLLTTNAYAVQPTFYRRAFPEDWEANMMRDAELAAKLAVQARQESGNSGEHVRIFGCLPPLSESHRPDAFQKFLAEEGEEFVVRTYRGLAQAALRGGADALMLENMVCWEEAALGLQATKDFHVSVILSMEGALRNLEREPHPEKAPEVARLVLKAKLAGAPIEALGFSCTEPETILECLEAIEAQDGLSRELKEAGLRLSAHANVNDRKEAHKKGFDVRTDKSQDIKARDDLVYDGFGGYVKFCKKFAKHGATYLGGCCGCGPAGINGIASQCTGDPVTSPATEITNGAAASMKTPNLAVAKALAPTGVLRVGLNLANTLLVTSYSGARSAEGVAPRLGAEIASRLGVDVRYIPFKTPGELGDAVDDKKWDIGFIGVEAQRATKITFAPPYVDIPATYLVRPGSHLVRVGDVDKEGVRIGSWGGTAYDLWLERNVKSEKLVRASSRDAVLQLLKDGKVEAVAGVRQHLLEDAKKLPGARVLEGSFMTVQQAICTPRGREVEAEMFLTDFVEKAKASGFVAGLLDQYGVAGKLVVSPPTAAAAGPAIPKKNAMKIVVLGCGAMGSVYAGLLASGGHEVWAVDVWKEHIDAIRERGLRVEGASGDRTVRVRATTDANEVGPCDLAIIATKASGVAAAAATALKLLKEDGVVLTIQNGLGAGDRIAQHLDPSRVMLGLASNFGASMKGPGHAEHKSMNLIGIGEMQGGETERLKRVVDAWVSSGFNAKGYADIHAQIWEKFICNCCYSGSCTATGMTVGEVQDNPAAWNIALTCAREADGVARAKRIRLSFEDVEAHVRKFGETVRHARPSMLQDHLAKRRSEIDFINGAVPLEAAKIGMPAPVNQAIADIVRAREAAFH